MAVEPREPDDDIARPEGLYLEKEAAVHHRVDHLDHVIRLLRVVGDDRLERLVYSLRVVVGREVRWVLQIVRREEREQRAKLVEGLLFAVGGEVRHTAAGIV